MPTPTEQQSMDTREDLVHMVRLIHLALGELQPKNRYNNYSDHGCVDYCAGKKALSVQVLQSQNQPDPMFFGNGSDGRLNPNSCTRHSIRVGSCEDTLPFGLANTKPGRTLGLHNKFARVSIPQTNVDVLERSPNEDQMGQYFQRVLGAVATHSGIPFGRLQNTVLDLMAKEKTLGQRLFGSVEVKGKHDLAA